MIMYQGLITIPIEQQIISMNDIEVMIIYIFASIYTM